jgi:uncharacterized membrane protein YccC
VLFAIERFLEISIGILIATLISQYVLPIHARTHLRRTQAETLTQLRLFYINTMVTREIKQPLDELDENIVQLILRQRQLAKESANERLGEKFNVMHFTKTLYCEREILRIISFMHHAFVKINDTETSLTNLPELTAFNDCIQRALSTFIDVIEHNHSFDRYIQLPDIRALRKSIQNQVGSLSQKQRIYVDGFVFAAEVLTDTIANLAQLYTLKVI